MYERIIMSKAPACLLVAAALLVVPAHPVRAAGAVTPDPLRQFSASIEALVTRVSPSVVQVLVTGYGPVDDGRESDTDVVVGKQRRLGSGVIIDSDGYIVTNAHVVKGGQRLEVVLSGSPSDTSPMGSLVGARGRTVEARVIGVAPEVDLALLKVDVAGLPALPLADYAKLRQGELVFAFGSPEGLRNSVTMGVVSAVARQPDTDHPMVYIQTDAPINHGNSGGPLVNVSGELVGINTFMLSESGGSQGLGFAIPSAIVDVASRQLREYGHLHQGQIGANLQTLTPNLARGLGLAQDWGVIVSDLWPGGPADLAGLRVKDVILSIDGRPMDSLPLVAFNLYARNAGEHLKLVVLRGHDQLLLDVPVITRAHDVDRLGDHIDPERSLVRQLGILGVAIDDEIRPMIPSLRAPSGVIVAARTEDPHAAEVSLSAGDVIHSVNGLATSTVSELRAALDDLKPHSPVVLQIEREGVFTFVAFALD
jgi:serine protease Do